MKRCEYRDEDCPSCFQLVPRRYRSTLCFYHQKIVAGLTLRVKEYLTDVEIDALFGGRWRSDGRRLDNYTR